MFYLCHVLQPSERGYKIIGRLVLNLEQYDGAAGVAQCYSVQYYQFCKNIDLRYCDKNAIPYRAIESCLIDFILMGFGAI